MGNTVTIHSIDDKHPVPLALHHLPIAITFALFDDGQQFMVDPALVEELSCDGLITIAFNVHKEICCLHKAGGIPIDMEMVSVQ